MLIGSSGKNWVVWAGNTHPNNPPTVQVLSILTFGIESKDKNTRPIQETTYQIIVAGTLDER
jgi:hypothetical protein